MSDAVTPDQALAYVRRTVGGEANISPDEDCLVFGDFMQDNVLFVPLDEADDEGMNILLEDLAEREGCDISDLVDRIATEPVVQIDEVAVMRLKRQLAAASVQATKIALQN